MTFSKKIVSLAVFGALAIAPVATASYAIAQPTGNYQDDSGLNTDTAPAAPAQSPSADDSLPPTDSNGAPIIPGFNDDPPVAPQRPSDSNSLNRAPSGQSGMQFNPPSGDMGFGDKPLFERDTSQDVGGFLKNNQLDQEGLMTGYQNVQPLVKWISLISGYLIGLLVVSLAFFNLLGLVYIVIPIGALRTLLSGGRYNPQGTAAGGMAGGGMGSMGGGMGPMGGTRGGYGGSMRGGYGGGMGPVGGGAGTGGAQGTTTLSKLRIVPDAAITAVEMANAQAQPQGGMGGGMMGGMQQQQQPAQKSFNPVMWYLKQQMVMMIATGIALVLLVLSSVLFDTGINLGNAAVQAIQWLLAKIIN